MFAPYGKALQLLNEAHDLNPGPWREHSLQTALAAKKIAEKTTDMDPSKAYSLGLLHDIGRYKGFTYLQHTVDGYKYLMEKGYDENAVICLTYSFPITQLRAFIGKIDCSKEDVELLENFLNSHSFDDYDRLIQLCDSMALPDRICIIEERLIDVSIRYGVNEYSVEKWKAYLNLKKYFDEKIGINLYDLFLS